MKKTLLILILAAMIGSGYAKENKLDDCLLLNQFGRIADSTISSVFIVKNNTIITPAITEGSINGVMRRHLLESLGSSDFKIQQSGLTIEDLEMADEIFLTNAIRGIRWVSNFRNNTYGNELTKEIYRRFLQTLY